MPQSNLDKAKWKLDNCKIRSPITGTILKKNAEEGNLVNAIAFSGSVSLCEMADLSDLEVDLTIQERDVVAGLQGPEVQGAGRGVSRSRLLRSRLAADADRRPLQRGDSGPGEIDGSPRGRGRVSEAGDGGDRHVLRQSDPPKAKERVAAVPNARGHDHLADRNVCPPNNGNTLMESEIKVRGLSKEEG